MGDFKTSEIPIVIRSGFRLQSPTVCKRSTNVCVSVCMWCMHSCDRSLAAAFGATNVAEKEVRNNSNNVLLRSGSAFIDIIVIQTIRFSPSSAVVTNSCCFFLHATLQQHNRELLFFLSTFSFFPILFRKK